MLHEESYASNFGEVSSISSEKILDPLERLEVEAQPTLALLVEVIVNWSFGKFGQEEFIAAKEEFHRSTGIVFYDDPFYHQRMCYFLDYFSFQRPLQGSLRENDRCLTPYKSFLESDAFFQLSKNKDRFNQFITLGHFRHSLFKIKSFKKDYLLIVDLLTQLQYKIEDTNKISLGFDVNSILQGFIYTEDKTAKLSHGIFAHPREVSRAIKKVVKKVQKQSIFSEATLLIELAKGNMHLLRHKHLNTQAVYAKCLKAFA